MSIEDGNLPIFDEKQRRRLICQLHSYLLRNVDQYRDLILDESAFDSVESWVLFGARLGYFFRELETHEGFEKFKEASN